MFKYRHAKTGVIINTPAQITSPTWLPVPDETAPKKTPAKKTTTRKKVQKDVSDIHND